MGAPERPHGGRTRGRHHAFRKRRQVVDAHEFGRIRGGGSLFRAVSVLGGFAARQELDSAPSESDKDRRLRRQKRGPDRRRRKALQAGPAPGVRPIRAGLARLRNQSGFGLAFRRRTGIRDQSYFQERTSRRAPPVDRRENYRDRPRILRGIPLASVGPIGP